MASRRSTSPGFRDDRYRAVIAKLTATRKELGISQEILAGHLGLHKQFVSRVELGERRLDFVELVDFAQALGLKAEELVADIPRVG